MAAYNFHSLVIRHGASNYHLVGPIGTWGPDLSNIIYEAYIFPRLGIRQLDHVAVKLVDRTRGNHYYDLAEDDIMKSLTIPDPKPPNLLLYRTAFCERVNGVKTLCIVVPFDEEVVSIRSLISKSPRFAYGIPQDCIAIALDGVLRGLINIHYWDRYHNHITAGNIYYRRLDDKIKLAYAAAVYDRREVVEPPSPPEFVSDEEAEDDEPPPLEEALLPMNQLTDWGRAPEVVKDEELMGEMSLYMNQSQKSDIWLVGIAALEMAYGKIKVANRDELLFIGEYISKKRRMPNTWEELRAKYVEHLSEIRENKKKNKKKKKKKIRRLKFKWPKKFLDKIVLKVEEPRRFTKLFASFVGFCLKTDPEKRPTAFQLRCHKFFGFNVQSTEYFRYVMVKELNIPVAKVFEKMKFDP